MATIKKPAPPVPGPVQFQLSHSDDLETSGNDFSVSSSEMLDLAIHLPDGSTVVASVDPNKPMMDLLVRICGQHRLSPADYMLQVFSEDSSLPITYTANQTFASLNASFVKLIPKWPERDKHSTQQPFEITQRLIVCLPNNQKFVMRVRPDIGLSELFKTATSFKGLDPNRYQLTLPQVNSDTPLDMDLPLNYYGVSEIHLVSKQASLEHNNNSRSAIQTDLPVVGILKNQSRSDIPVNQRNTMTSASVSNHSAATGRPKMEHSSSVPVPESTGFPTETKYEKKKGFFSFLKRKKSGRFIFGSMQNLHQTDGGGGTLRIFKKSRETGSQSSLHRNSQPLPDIRPRTSSVSEKMSEAVVEQPVLPAPITSVYKKRQAPQPPGAVAQLAAKKEMGRQTNGTSSIPVVAKPPVKATEPRNITRLESTPFSNLQTDCEQKSMNVGQNKESTKNIKEFRHSPSSSQSSGFEELLSSPSEDSKRANFDAIDSSAAVALGYDGGIDLRDSSAQQLMGKTKRRAPAPPSGAVKAVLSSAAVSSSTSSTSSSVHDDQCVNDELVKKNPQIFSAVDDNSPISDLSSTNSRFQVHAESGLNLSSKLKSESSIKDTPEPSINNKVGSCNSSIIEESTCEENDEEDDCFCEHDAGYDGEIMFDNDDIMFVAPEATNLTKPKTNFIFADAIDDGKECYKDNKSVDIETTQSKAESATSPSVSVSSQHCVMPDEVKVKFKTSSNHADVDNFSSEGATASESLPSISNPATESFNDSQETCIPLEFTDNSQEIKTDTADCSERESISFGQPRASQFEKKYVDSFLPIVGKDTSEANSLVLESTAVEYSQKKLLAPPKEFLDQLVEDGLCSDIAERPTTEISDAVLQSSQKVKTAGSQEPRTIIIDKPKAVSTCSLPISVHLQRNSSETVDCEKLRVSSGKPECNEQVASSKQTGTRLSLSGEAHEKLVSGSFVADHSASSRFYPFFSALSGISQLNDSNYKGQNDSSVSANENVINTETKNSVKVAGESSQGMKTPMVTSLRDLKSKPGKSEPAKRSLYHLIKHSEVTEKSASVNVSDADKITSNSRDESTVSSSIPKHQQKQPMPTSPVPFATELQKHLLKWQQQHHEETSAASNDHNIVFSKAAPDSVSEARFAHRESTGRQSSGVPSTTQAVTSSSISVSEARSAHPESTGHQSSGVPSTTQAVTSSSNKFVKNSGANAGQVTGSKTFSKTDVVFTMEQLMAAKSGLRKTGNEQSNEQHQTLYRAVSKNSAPGGNSDSSLSKPETASVANHKPINNYPPPPPAFPAVGNKQFGNNQSQSVLKKNVGRQTTVQPLNNQVDVRDQLLSAIRNAGGKPVKHFPSVSQ